MIPTILYYSLKIVAAAIPTIWQGHKSCRPTAWCNPGHFRQGFEWWARRAKSVV